MHLDEGKIETSKTEISPRRLFLKKPSGTSLENAFKHWNVTQTDIGRAWRILKLFYIVIFVL